jgi:hypothetical protein
MSTLPNQPDPSLPCREVFARGQKTTDEICAVVSVEQEIAALHQGFWQHGEP